MAEEVRRDAAEIVAATIGRLTRYRPAELIARLGPGLYDRDVAELSAGKLMMQLPHDGMLLRIHFGARPRQPARHFRGSADLGRDRGEPSEH